jgi:hypothetical protein
MIHYYYSSPTTAFEETVLEDPGRRRPSLTPPFPNKVLSLSLSLPPPPPPIHLISFWFGHFGPGSTETDITVLSFRLENRGSTLESSYLFPESDPYKNIRV